MTTKVEPTHKINCCDKCRAWSLKFKSDVYPCHNTDCECHVKVKPTVEKWEEKYV